MVDRPTPWTAHPRIGGVSAFGIGGTNAHVVVEHAPARDVPERAARPVHPLVLSARDTAALRHLASAWADHLRTHPDADLGDLAHTAATGRSHLEVRAAAAVATRSEAIEVLDALARDEAVGHRGQVARSSAPPSVGVLLDGVALPGDVARDLQAHEPVFDEALRDLAALIPNPSAAATGFAQGVALFALWRSWGLRAASVSGVGIGQLAADAASGRTDLATAFRQALQHPQPPPDTGWQAAFEGADQLLLTLGGTSPGPWAGLADALARLFVHGVPLDWHAIGATRGLRRVLAPTYRFQRERFWLDAGRRGSAHWSDHVVGDEAVVPAAAFVVLALEALEGSQQLVDLRIRRALPVRDAQALTARIEANDELRFVCGDGSTDPAVGGARCVAASEPPRGLALRELQQHCSEALAAPAFYADLAAVGLRYGPRYRRIEALWRGSSRALGRLATRPASDPWDPDLDAALQLVFAAVDPQLQGQRHVPVAIERVVRPSSAVARWAVAEVRHQAPGEIVADVALFDEDGRTTAQLLGVSLRRAGARARSAPAARPPAAAAAPASAPALPRETVRHEVERQVRLALGLRPGAAVDRPLHELGLDSYNAVELRDGLAAALGLELPASLAYDHGTVSAIAEFVEQRTASAAPPQAPTAPPPPAPAEPQPALRRSSRPRAGTVEVAIVGLAGRYPGARDVGQLWDVLVQGHDCITEIPASRWSAERWFDADRAGEGTSYSRWGGFVDDVDAFDPLFFNISPRQAEVMDPQERLFLQTAWEALEDAGHTPEGLWRAGLSPEEAAVYVGVMWSTSQLNGAETRLGRAALPFSSYWGVANRVSYVLDFQGPSMAVDTACSSSLTALHLATEAITAGSCRLALVGGVNLSLHPYKYAVLSQGRFLSTDGRCRSFGEGGDGYVPGEGIGAVVLRPLADALADGDQIYGVVRGTAVNHGGRASAFTVPSARSQAQLIRRSLQRAELQPSDLDYVEAHGTGTALGDPIEIAALSQALGPASGERWPIGSVKSNIGHLEAAAGIAGLTKVLLQMRHRTLAPSLHAAAPNPHIDFDAAPVQVVSEATPWQPRGDAPLRAAISSFGAGGSNAHAVVEEGPHRPSAAVASERDLVVLSARDAERLRAYAERFVALLQQPEPPPLRDLAHTSRVGRVALSHRLAVVASSSEQLRERLAAFVADGAAEGLVAGAAGALPLSTEVDEDRAFLRSLVAAGQLQRIGQLWVAGAQLHWEALLDPAGRRRVGLPTYPFAQERYWLSGIPESGATPSPPTPEVPAGADVPCFAPRWRLAPLPQAEALDLSHAVVWVPRGASEQQRGEVARWLGVGRVVEATPEAVDALPPGELVLLDACDLVAHVPGFDADRVEALQQVLERSSVIWLHLTPDLRAGTSMAGATMQGLARALNAEARALSVRTVDLDEAARAPQVLQRIVREEIAHVRDGGPVRVAYRGSTRSTVHLAPVAPVAGGVVVDPARAYVVTGGTRGLGAAFARDLVRRGARRLAILGARALPERSTWPAVSQSPGADGDKVRHLLALEAEGVELRLYTGSLVDEGLQPFLQEVRTQLGPLGGVLHCAGVTSSESPAFLRKTAAGLAAVSEPKVAGTLALARALRADQPDFVVLFSSVSATAPSLAVGLSDYAACNGFLDRFAEHMHARSRTAFRSVAWPSFHDEGFGAVTTEAYRASGLDTLGVDQGVAVLDRVLTLADEPVVLVCPLTRSVDPDTWLRAPVARETRSVSTPAPARAPSSSTDARQRASSALMEIFSAELKLQPERLRTDVPLDTFGADSVLIASAVRRIEQLVGGAFDPSAVLSHDTLDALSDYLVAHHGEAFQSPSDAPEPSPPAEPAATAEQVAVPMCNGVGSAVPSHEPVACAIVGVDCRFPGGGGVDAFWGLLEQGRCAVREVPSDRWSADAYYAPEPAAGRTTSKWGGFLEAFEAFDADYFGVSDALAMQMDPLQRLMLTTALGATLSAGYSREELHGQRVGVYVGSRSSTYAGRIATPDRHTIVGVGQNFIAARISDFFDWRGTNLVVDTACSSSLVSLHLACQALRSGEVDAALVGGVDLLLDERTYLTLSAAGALSPDGVCRAFDQGANGFVPGEGAGAVLVKRLDDALRDGDRVLAVVRGSAVNNDGHTMGITTPNMEAQVDVIRSALQAAKVSAADVSYVEAHGTGTLIGDPIELRALSTAFRAQTDAVGFCGLGSVKTNIGHLLSAAGIASVIKTALALDRRLLPPTLNCAQPNPRFAFEDSPFYVHRARRPWPASPDRPRRAGVSAFGFGGTNCHVVLEGMEERRSAVRTPLPAPPLRTRGPLLPATARVTAPSSGGPSLLALEPLE
ncbi:MAG: KR domain-containing protein [Myxococcales bacterium]|nr:KR domain-containing protein [Myxococcales bacterium]